MRNAFALGTLLVASVAALLAGAAGPAGGAPAAVPQGTILFTSDRSGNFEIYSVRAVGSRLGQLTRNRLQDAAPLLSPDGRRIVFKRGADDYTPGLWLMNADGSQQRRLAGYGSNPAWSPDSRRIAYSGSGRSGANSSPLVILSADDGRRVVVHGSNGAPSWSLDGTRLAFWRGADLATVGSDGSGLRTVRRNVALGGGRLAWSPRGQVAFATYRGTYVVWPNGRGFRRLVQGGVGGFAWSPDGRRLALADEKGRLHVASASGRGLRDITPKGAGWMDSPAWSPDGRWIAVRSLPAGATYHDLLVVAREGSPSRRITSRIPYPWGSDNRQPSWLPRGATPARLGRRPAAPLRSETVSPSTFLVAARDRA